jgi:capsule polysaccharide export protein KpsE/RkpR
MDKVNTENNLENQIIYDDDFNLLDLIAILQNSKKSILSIALISFFGASIYSATSPDVYTSDSLLTIVDDSEAGGSGFQNIASRYGGLASLAGVSINSGASLKSDHIIATIKSRAFYEHIAKLDGIYPSLVAAESYDPQTKKLSFNESMYNSDEMKWVNDKPSFLSSHYEFFIENLTVAADKKTGFIFLAFKHISPEFAYKMTSTIIHEANNIVRLQHIEETNKSLSYLNNELKNTLEIGTKDSISTLIDAQLKVKMIANVRENYVLRPIDDPFLPEWKSGPDRIRIVILATIIGLIAGSFLGLYLHYFTKKNI